MNYLDDEFIKTSIENGKIVVGGKVISEEFCKHLNTLAFYFAGGIDWSISNNSSSYNWDVDYDDGLLSWAEKLSIGKYAYVGLVFNTSTEALIMKRNWALSNFDELIYKAPGRRYLFGVTQSNGLQPNFDALIEYDGNLTFVGSN